MERKNLFTLDRTPIGCWVRVREIRDPGLRKQALRLGLTENCQVRCIANLPGGPVVIGLGAQKIAIGRELARRIIITGVSWTELHRRKP